MPQPGGELVKAKSLISLFCGPGGLDQGFKEAGFQTLLAIDKDRAAVETHRQNHPEAGALVVDLTKDYAIDVIWDQCQVRFRDQPPVGIIGGPPCQSFSIGNSNQKEDDPRHLLPKVYAKVIGELNNRYKGLIDFCVFENVMGLKILHSDRFSAFLKEMANAGFQPFVGELDAQHFEVPQRRRRIFVVGINKKKHKEFRSGPKQQHFQFPRGNQAKVPVQVAFDQVTHEAVIANSKLSPDEVKAIAGHWNHWCMEPVSEKFICKLNTKDFDGKSYRIAEVDPSRSCSRGKLANGKSFKMLTYNEPSYTVAYGHREVHMHPKGHRRLSVYEAMLLQGFPTDYRLLGTLTDQIRLVSEAVSPPVAHALAEAIDQQLFAGGGKP